MYFPTKFFCFAVCIFVCRVANFWFKPQKNPPLGFGGGGGERKQSEIWHMRSADVDDCSCFFSLIGNNPNNFSSFTSFCPVATFMLCCSANPGHSNVTLGRTQNSLLTILMDPKFTGGFVTNLLTPNHICLFQLFLLWSLCFQRKSIECNQWRLPSVT